VNILEIGTSSGADHAVGLLGQGDAPQHVFVQAGIAPNFPAIRTRPGHHDAGGIEHRRIAIHPLRALPIGAIYKSILAQ
jgi:hypothetical protein